VYCHPAERAAAEEGEPRRDYHRIDRLRIPSRWVYPRLQDYWNSGPVEIAGTIGEGDDVCGFRVVHLPGHAPGLVGLWRESDRVALTSDCFYVVDSDTSRPQEPAPAVDAFNQDTAQARESIRKLAALDPAVCWPGHLGPLEGDVRARLEQAAGA
jgi:hydroxyacylglutathione hydrolase